MKICVLIFFSFFCALHSQAEVTELAERDREKIIEELKLLQETAKEKEERIRRASISAFKDVIDDDEKTFDLYEKCVNKVLYEDQKKEAQEFREWKKRQREREDSNEFRRALRHQLNWLLFLIEATWELEKREQEEQKEAEKTGEPQTPERDEKKLLPEDLVFRAVERVDNVLADGQYLKKQIQLLERSVTGSVFAKAYKVKIAKNLPNSPLRLANLYSKSVLPLLKKKGDVEIYRKAHKKWITQELRLIELKDLANKEPSSTSTNFEKFAFETRPKMLWQLERTIFYMGDKEGAVFAMMNHLKHFKDHDRHMSWAKELLKLLEKEGPQDDEFEKLLNQETEPEE